MIQIHQQRRVAGHDDLIGIALEAGHERGFADGAAQITLAGVLSDSVFADENFGAGSILVVILGGVAHEPFWSVVVMVIHNIWRAIAIISPAIGHQSHVGIFLLDGFIEQRPAFEIGGTVGIFVADFHVGQIKRRRMPCCSPA